MVTTRKDARTYEDLLQLAPWSTESTCCACHGWGVPTWRLSTRASICRECIEKKGAKLLGSVERAERRVREWIKSNRLKGNELPNDQFVSSITGVRLDRVTEIRAELQS